ncbi:nuclear transport factor 2 family protein [Nocardia sp. alder85J]|uniref:nuclear transport factor 2 family protein n=1 Tax=Nocardia sp. alder85J TaxID=2862949 RepID=UPI001CD30D72|nr:nuclear transport factor 2 family protein [Nocardia sp. alder85J]MCX4096306.1 nuclear transport factor 2 family protein [Nocardia sp. alder85J]
MDSRELILHAWREFATQDPARIAAVFTSDAEWLAPLGNATARALHGTNHLVGRDRIVRFLAVEFPAVFVADRKVEFTAVIAAGTRVMRAPGAAVGRSRRITAGMRRRKIIEGAGPGSGYPPSLSCSAPSSSTKRSIFDVPASSRARPCSGHSYP